MPLVKGGVSFQETLVIRVLSSMFRTDQISCEILPRATRLALWPLCWSPTGERSLRRPPESIGPSFEAAVTFLTSKRPSIISAVHLLFSATWQRAALTLVSSPLSQAALREMLKFLSTPRVAPPQLTDESSLIEQLFSQVYPERVVSRT